jgi:hypothetical protein
MLRLLLATILVAVFGCFAEEPSSPSKESAAMTPTAPPKAVRVVRDQETVLLEGVEPFLLNTHKATPIACFTVVMRAVGEDVTYPWLMGVSGQAFRFQLSKGFAPQSNGWCGSSPHPNCGYETAKYAIATLPYEPADYVCAEKGADVAAARAAVVASIDAGIPAIASSEESSVIVGYSQNGTVLLRRQTWDDGSKPPEKWKGTPWGFHVFKPRAAKPDRTALVKESLARAVEVATLAESGVKADKPNSGYDAGLPALRRWVKELRNDETWNPLPEASVKRVAQFNAWIYEGLCDARASAAIYLKEIASQFPEPQRAHLLAAAELYQQETKTLVDTCPVDVAPYPWMLKNGKKWDNAMRHHQADLLEQAISFEERAIAELKAASAKTE